MIERIFPGDRYIEMIDNKCYKYFNAKYKSAYFYGLFYINTFGNIRKFDNGVINDETEGKVHNTSGDIDIEVDGSNPGHKQTIDNLRLFGIEAKGSCRIEMNNVNSINVMDAYMYCLTTTRNDNYWKDIPESQGGPYDCCIEIPDLGEFSKVLYSALKKQDDKVGDYTIRKVYFESNKGILADNTVKLPCFFRKPDKDGFKQQNELRIVIDSSLESLIPKHVFISPSLYKIL